MRFSNIIILGNGRIACDCVEILIRYVELNDVVVIESQHNSLSMLKTICERKKVSFLSDNANKKSIELLRENLKNNTLIVSVNNEILIPEDICKTEGVEIINFHYGYLPYYRGMNIPSWVIYNGEPFTGVTWHYINERIDDGDIICRKRIPIDETTTAMQIVQKGMDIGRELFESFIEDFLKKQPETIENKSVDSKLFKRKQIPGDGVVFEEMQGAEMSRVLRAFDYGPMNMIGDLKIVIKSEEHIIKRYKIIKNGDLLCGDLKGEGDYHIAKDGYLFDFKWQS